MRTRTRQGPDPSANGRITARRLVTTPGIATRQIVRAVRTALGNRSCRNLAVVVVNDEQIARLHGQFMAEPTATDVLAFDLRDDPADEQIDGEIVLSAETAERQARRFHTSPGEELLRYAIHGTLHLIGLEDHTPADRRKMRREENRILAELAGNRIAAARRTRPTPRRLKRSQRTASRVQH